MLHVKTPTPVQYDDGAWVYRRYVLDELILKLRQLKGAVNSLAFIFIANPPANYHRIVAGKVRRRFERCPAQLDALQASKNAKETCDPTINLIPPYKPDPLLTRFFLKMARWDQ